MEKQHLRPKCGRCAQPLNLGRSDTGVVELNDSTFYGFVQNAALPVLVDFYSPTCAPCQSMMPVIKALAARYAGKAIITKVNTTTNHLVPSQFTIRGVPTFLFFTKGRLVDQVTGAVPEQVLCGKLDALL